MKLTQKQIEKRAEIIEVMINSLMEGHNVKDATRHPMTREEAIGKFNWLLEDKKNLSILNALAAAF